MTGDRLTRRRLLGAAGAGLAVSVAGCGYQPAGGDLHLVDDRLVVVDGTDLYGFYAQPGARYTLL